MIFLIVALIWAIALLPPLLRARLEANSVDSVGKFRRHLRVLESTSPAAGTLAGFHNRSTMPAAWAHEARRLRLRRRRQQVVNTLLALMATTLVLGLIPKLHWFLLAHVVFDLAFVAYARSLVKIRSQAMQASAVNGDEVLQAPVPMPARSAGGQAL